MPLNPDRLDKIRAGNEPSSTQTRRRLGATGIERVVLEAKSNTHNDLASRSLEAIDDLYTRLAFDKAFTITDEIYADICPLPPTPEEWVRAGINFVDLADEYEYMQSEGLKPELIIAAQLSKQEAIDLFKIKAASSSNILMYNGLYIDGNISDVWQEIDTPYSTQPIARTGTTDWTMLLVDGRETAENRGISHVELYYQNGYCSARTIAISQYLRLQLGRVLDNKLPIDTTDFGSASWLKGEYSVGYVHAMPFAPYGQWDSSTNRVSIRGCADICNWPFLGERTAVW